MEWENGVMGSILVPDVITPEQFYDSRHDDSAIAPVKRLMMAVLEDALRCFQNNSSAKSGPRKRLFADADVKAVPVDNGILRGLRDRDVRSVLANNGGATANHLVSERIGERSRERHQRRSGEQ